MKRTHAAKVSHEGQIYKVAGFVQTIRKHGKIAFLVLRDVSGTVQVVVEDKQLLSKISGLSRESVVEVIGGARLPESKVSTVAKLELIAKKIKILSKAAPLPFTIFPKEDASLPVRLDYRWLDLRRYEKQLIFRIWTIMEKAFEDFLIERGFIKIHTPKLMPSISEGEEELFYLEYFGQKAYLAQSAQFYKQMAMAAGFEKVFQIGPVFRANKAFTTRHDTEFTQYDIEVSYVTYKGLMKLESEIIVEMLSKIREVYGKQIQKYYGIEIEIPSLPFPVLKLAEAKGILRQFNVKHRKEGDLSPEEERILGKYIKEKYGHDFVFITHYPASKRAFYHKRLRKQPEYAAGFDLLYKGLEITTGSEREHRLDILIKQAKQSGINLESIAGYLEFFKYGMPPHGGFGFGPSRFLMQLLNMPNVREVTYVYRGVKRLRP